MQISNQALIALLAVTVVLVGAAAFLVLRPSPPVAGAESEARVETIVELPPEVYRTGQTDFEPEGPVRIRAAEDTHLRMDCDGLRMDRTIGAEGVAVFDPVPTVGCALEILVDNQPAGEPFDPVLPGDDIGCSLDAEAGRVICEDSLAEKHGATVLAWSWGEGRVTVDGVDVGPVPVENLRLPVGRHRIEFQGERARSAWSLTVQPDERIEIFFHSPAREEQDLPRRPVDAVMEPPAP